MHKPHIAILHVKSVPADAFNDFTQTISSENLDFQVESREDGGPFAALEWLLPTAIIVYISKSYFDGFLKEMGKDHYNLLKMGLGKLRKWAVGPSAPKVTLLGSSGKITKEQPYSLVFSALAEADSGITFKLLIQTGISEQEYEDSVKAFLDFLFAFHAGTLNANTLESLSSTRVVSGTLLVAFNHTTKVIEPIDPIPKRLPPNVA